MGKYGNHCHKMIPQTIHFVFGLSEDFAGMPFSLYHYLAALSAKVINKDYEVVMHYHYEPVNNEWWERCKQIVTMDRLLSSPTTICGKTIKHCAHKADWVRVEVLLADGGIYLDMDTLCIAPFTPLMNKKFVMGLEVWHGQITGMCNAVIISEKDHPFLKLWEEGFSEFNPDDWNKIACRKPLELALKHPHLIHIEPPESFFRLTWSPEDIKIMHEEMLMYERSYSQHLWEHGGAYPHLSKITVADIMLRDSTYNILAREVIHGNETYFE